MTHYQSVELVNCANGGWQWMGQDSRVTSKYRMLKVLDADISAQWHY